MARRLSGTVIICFDIGGTLVDGGPSFAASIQRLVGRSLLQSEWNEYVNLAAGSAEDDLAKLARYFKLPLADVMQQYHLHLGRPRGLYGDVLPTLRALEDFRCVALSNAPRWLTSDDLGGAESHLMRIFHSYEIGYAKPDSRAFGYVEEVLGVSAEEMLMVGDSLTYDYRAALTAGWRALLLDRNGQHNYAPDVERITALTALVDRLTDYRKLSAPTPAAIEVEGMVKRSGTSALITVPGELLGRQYTARPVRLHAANGSCRARLARGRAGQAVLLLTPSQIYALGLPPVAREVRLRIEVIAEKLQLVPPVDLENALIDAGLCWDSIPERDRHLAVGLVNEARTTELRERRIRRIVSSFQGEGK